MYPVQSLPKRIFLVGRGDGEGVAAERGVVDERVLFVGGVEGRCGVVEARALDEVVDLEDFDEGFAPSTCVWVAVWRAACSWTDIRTHRHARLCVCARTAFTHARITPARPHAPPARSHPLPPACPPARTYARTCTHTRSYDKHALRQIQRPEIPKLFNRSHSPPHSDVLPNLTYVHSPSAFALALRFRGDDTESTQAHTSICRKGDCPPPTEAQEQHGNGEG